MPLTLDGSWLNETIVDHFKDYAKVAFENFGDRVKLWLTFNEPHVFCPSDWTYGEHDPFQDPPVKPYVCAHNVVKSHAVAYRVYDEMFRQEQNGKIGITLNCDWPEPKNLTNPSHVEASDRSMHFHVSVVLCMIVKCKYSHEKCMCAIKDSDYFSMVGGQILFCEENILR